MRRLAQALGALRDFYPRQDFPDRSVSLYAAMLEDMDGDDVTNAIHRLVRKSTWLPSIADIRREVAEERAALPTPEEAWSMAVAARGHGGLPPEVAAAVRDLGGTWNLLHSDRAASTRQAFMRAYERRREDTILGIIGAGTPRQRLQLDSPDPPQERPALGESARIRPRPILFRMTARWAGRPLAAPTEEEKADAIRLLEQGPINGMDDPLYLEAERVFAEAAFDATG
jgi:hypothetical protein